MLDRIKSHAFKLLQKLGRLPRGYQALATGLGTLIVISWPRKAAALAPSAQLTYITPAQRDQYYGPITYVAAPTADNPEGIRITNDFEAQNIVRKSFPLIGRAAIHRKAAPSLEAALSEIESRGLGHLVRSFEGGYYPRFVRNSRSNLSSHSYGTSIDINARENAQGTLGTEDQDRLGAIFEQYGWYYGKRFSNPDPMHMEYVLPA